MAVQITVSKTLGGGSVNDILSGGVGGYYLGVAAAGKFTDPNEVYVRHDGAERIIDLALYTAPFSQFYGGNVTAGNNYLQLALWGDEGYGLQMSEQAFGADAFSFIFDGNNGFTFGNRRQVLSSAMLYNNAGTPTVPSAAEDGVVGPIGDTSYGDTCFVKLRVGVPAPPLYIGGAIQFDLVFFYQFTS